MSPKIETYSIGNVEQMTGVSQRQLRRWEGRYFPEPERVVCGDRAYRRDTSKDVELVRKIKDYQDQGFTLVDAKAIHDRYKDLSMGETAFRTSKTSHLEVRPAFVRSEAGTRGHVLVVMLAYMLVRELKRAWKDLDLTVEEGLGELNRICAMELSVAGVDSVLRLPEPSPLARQLLNSLHVNLPPVLPGSKVVVDTKRKLPTRRKDG